MVDFIKLLLAAGDGGQGRVSFRREKFIPKGGPDGGDGGIGGSIILRASKEYSTLGHLAGKKKYIADAGGAGGGRNKFGAKGEDTIIDVPVGTTIWVLAENPTSYWQRNDEQALARPLKQFELEKVGGNVPRKIGESLKTVAAWQRQTPDWQDVIATDKSLRQADFRQIPKFELFTFTQPGEEVIVCRGGRGGKGNARFASSSNTTPLQAEFGGTGEQKIVVLEMKLLAQVGLVGFPNAGKSTLLTMLTQARPKIASYPFTTLEPQLGVMRLGEGKEVREVVLADIPGLIEGAADGKGLGHHFLRHIENCRALVILIALADEQELNSLLETNNYESIEQYLVKHVANVWQQLRQELAEYANQLVEKPSLLVINKIDLYDQSITDNVITGIKEELGLQDILAISAATNAGLSDLKEKIYSLAQ